jgi:prolipoprotein diacylglyceryltransferase
MYPVVNILGGTYSSYLVINHVLGLLIPAALYLIFLRGYSKKKAVEVEWPKFLCALVVIIVGGRLFARGIYEAMYLSQWTFPFNYRLGEGSIMFGGFLGAIISITLITYFRNRRTLFWLDAASIWMCFALGIRKIGCFMTGCCRGTETILPWGVMFPGSTFPVHPLQLYESLFGFGMAIYLWRRFMKEDMSDGAGFFLFFSLFSLLRLVTLPIREIPMAANYVAFGPIAFLVLAVAAGIAYFHLTRGGEEEVEGESEAVY